MRANRLRLKKSLAAAVVGLMFLNANSCLPKDYVYNFAAAGRTTILSAFAESVFTAITDTLFPNLDEEDPGTDTTTGA